MADHPQERTPSTRGDDYAARLDRLQNKWWKKALDVQRPYRWNLRRWELGATLDVGCGNGRNLVSLPPGSVGVDHNPALVAAARNRGCEAYTDGEFFADPVLSRPGRFDSLLAAHLIEHLVPADARVILGSYLSSIRPGGRVLFITPQERGHASDPTHLAFTDHAALRTLARDLGLEILTTYSFPFPRFMGRLFIYNEFVLVARIPPAGQEATAPDARNRVPSPRRPSHGSPAT
ncbi:class I SAM-dependent methyltransferase [Protaetiibacter larvae]|uniref:class I SAM-dependent methyltransferase n=1 Tax=Protaetiibacter larvae TaxID=2592654 RepID=UPI001FEC0756|nr:class I SAM-dependent methyltransferase [Protaetiibacter larvae]